MERQDKDRIQELMVCLADGDRSAFEPLYEALWPIVRRFAARALVGSPDVDDAAQGAFMKIFSRAADFDSERDAVSWVLGVAAYECKTFRQKAQRRREDKEAEPGQTDAGPSPEDAVIARDLEASLLDVLGTLSLADRDTLRAIMDGKRPDVPSATFRKRMERAVHRLRAAWSSRHGLD